MDAVKRTHPILIIAGVAVTLFSLAGIGAIMGWIPTSTGQNAQSAVTAPAIPPVAQAPQPEAPAPQAAEPAKIPAPVHRQAKRAPKHQPVQVAAAEPQMAQVPPPPPPAPVKPVCYECGVIDGIHEVDIAGKGTGGGAIGGAIAGGVVGHQMGNGRGQDLMTVVGALGGALAGHTIEKKVTASKEYEILVRFEDGNSKIIKSATPPAWHVGDKVKVVNGVIQSNG